MPRLLKTVVRILRTDGTIQRYHTTPKRLKERGYYYDTYIRAWRKERLVEPSIPPTPPIPPEPPVLPRVGKLDVEFRPPWSDKDYYHLYVWARSRIAAFVYIVETFGKPAHWFDEIKWDYPVDYSGPIPHHEIIMEPSR